MFSNDWAKNLFLFPWFFSTLLAVLGLLAAISFTFWSSNTQWGGGLSGGLLFTLGSFFILYLLSFLAAFFYQLPWTSYFHLFSLLLLLISGLFYFAKGGFFQVEILSLLLVTAFCITVFAIFSQIYFILNPDITFSKNGSLALVFILILVIFVLLSKAGSLLESNLSTVVRFLSFDKIDQVNSLIPNSSYTVESLVKVSQTKVPYDPSTEISRIILQKASFWKEPAREQLELSIFWKASTSDTPQVSDWHGVGVTPGQDFQVMGPSLFVTKLLDGNELYFSFGYNLEKMVIFYSSDGRPKSFFEFPCKPSEFKLQNPGIKFQILECSAEKVSNPYFPDLQNVNLHLNFLF